MIKRRIKQRATLLFIGSVLVFCQTSLSACLTVSVTESIQITEQEILNKLTLLIKDTIAC